MNHDQPDRQHAGEYETESTFIHARDSSGTGLASHAVVVVDADAAKRFGSVPDRNVTMAGDVGHTLFARGRAPTMLKDHLYMILFTDGCEHGSSPGILHTAWHIRKR